MTRPSDKILRGTTPTALARRVSLHAKVDTLRAYTTPAIRPVELAEKAGMSRQYVCDVLNGRSMPSERLLNAARELGIPV